MLHCLTDTLEEQELKETVQEKPSPLPVFSGSVREVPPKPSQAPAASGARNPGENSAGEILKPMSKTPRGLNI